MKHVIAGLLFVGFIFTSTACTTGAGAPISAKQQIDRSDRVAFESLHLFQLTESSLYHAKAPWPSAEQHQQIGAKLSQAYVLVIDVANAGIALAPGAKITDQVLSNIATLVKLVNDIVDLVKTAPPNVQAQASKAEADTTALVTTVQAAGAK
jgi:hypothetical protein